jgi:putative endonuclease
MKVFNRETGRLGEDVAVRYLEKLGFAVIVRNYSTKFGEIDLICDDNGITVFVEVKAKKSKMFGTPEEMFTRGKYHKVKRMGQLYLHGKEVLCRIDMVAVELPDGQEPEVRYYKNVIY